MKQLTLILLLLIVSSFLPAQEADKETVAASQFTYDYLFLVEALIRHERYPEARKELDGLLRRVEDVYEKALVHQTYGYVAIGLNNYPGAIEHFQQAIDSGQLPAAVNHNLLYTTAQLYLQENKPKAALRLLREWFDSEKNPSPESRVLMAQIHYALKQWQAAVRELKQAISQSTEPQESWYQLLVGIYLDHDQLRAAADLLKKMLVLFPQKKHYWEQYAGVLMQLDRFREAGVVLTLAAQKGILQQAGLIRLARLYLHQNMPVNAAELLSSRLASGEIVKDRKSLNLLVDAWLLAREYDQALEVLDLLSAMDQSGESDLRAGALLAEQERWQAAARKLKSGLKQSSKPAARDWFLLGTVYVRMDEQHEAMTAFERALESAKTLKERQQAERWIAYLSGRE